MSLMRPNARVTIAGRRLSSAEGAVVAVRVDLGLGGAHDGARLTLWPESKFAVAAPGDAMVVALGDAGAEVDVLGGEVLAVGAGPQGLWVEGVAATIALSRRFKSQSYVNPTVADVVRDLVGDAAVERVDAPLKLGAWHAENRLSVWQQLQALARLAGADLGSAADGSLRFVAPRPGSAPTRLRYGAQLLHWDITRAAAPVAPALATHGAGSEAGSSRWHWLSHDPVGAGGDPARIPGALATRDAAQTAGQALADRVARRVRGGQVLVVGDAALRPGDTVELADLPGDDPGTLRVIGVQHRLDRASGFLTRLTVEAAS